MGPQSLRHEPQFRGSTVSKAHPSERQSVNPIGQKQSPPTHDLPPVQTRPHMPQFDSSVPVSTQAPLHSVGAEAGQTHIEVVHVAIGGQTLPHAPQFEVVFASVSQPSRSRAAVEQLAYPAAHPA